MDWRTLFRDFEATVDAPACFYYKELMQEYPAAKVVLTLREPDPWYKSWAKLYATLQRFRPLSRLIPKFRKLILFTDDMADKMFEFGDPLDHDNCIRVFQAHNEAVQQHVPADRLLVFRVTEGWEPLCAFLGCDVPDGVPFPHLNEGDQTMKAVVKEIFLRPWLRRVLVPALGMGLVVGAWWLFF